MSFDADQIYSLLPAVHRDRDAAQGFPLRQFIEIIAGQVAVLEDNLEQLYDNHFVETAAPWVLPYLGDLLGIRGLPSSSHAISSRAEVGHTVAYRRRKGTASALELLARDITGLPARAVEFFERIASTQHLNHARPMCRSFASLRDAGGLEFVGTPFETLMRTVELRRIEPGRGRWNIPNIGLFLWRLRSYSRTASPVVPVGELVAGDPLAKRRFRVHPLGMDTQLFIHPETEDDVSHLADPINVSLPITRRMLAGQSRNDLGLQTLYGDNRSVSIQEFVDEQYQRVPAERILVCDLSDADGLPAWNHENKVSLTQVAIDPQLGRLVFGAIPKEDHPPRVTYFYGFGSDIGGGEYGRTAASTAATVVNVQTVGKATSPQGAFKTVRDALVGLGTEGGAIKIFGSDRFVESLPDVVANGVAMEMVAADGSCPALLLKEVASGQKWTVRGNTSGRVSFDGLWLAGALRVADELQKLTMRHCTLAPRWGTPVTLSTFEIESSRTEVLIENCIVPSLRVGTDGVRLRLRNCVIDAGAADRFAMSNLTGDGPAGTWRLENCTVIGKVAFDGLELASNCIFLSQSVSIRRRQEGCVRFSWLPSDAITPRRFNCLSDGAGTASLRPQFTSLRWGDAGYAQLSRHCPEAIRSGADDGAEMGAFHDLFLPQKELHLRARLLEHLRFGLEAGVFYES